MKKMVFIIVLVFLFTGTAAGSNNFEGFPIVNVKVNGTLVEGDVPAINLNGRTMVPARFVTEALGADINWDAATNTVNVTSTSSATSSDEDIKTLKQLSQIAETYRSISALGDIISGISQGLSLSFDDMRINNSLNQLKKENERFSTIMEMYKEALSDVNNAITHAEKINEDISLLKNILHSYALALDNYDEAIDNLYDLYNTNQETYFDQYLEKSSQGFDLIHEAKSKALQGYFYYHDEVQSY